jgi:hypothetical protein
MLVAARCGLQGSGAKSFGMHTRGHWDVGKPGTMHSTGFEMKDGRVTIKR